MKMPKEARLPCQSHPMSVAQDLSSGKAGWKSARFRVE